VYFARAEQVLEHEGLDPVVTMEVFGRAEGILCGIDEAKNLLAHVLATADPAETASLIAGNLPPWVATGNTFWVWTRAQTNITNVCRFFSASFAPSRSWMPAEWTLTARRRPSVSVRMWRLRPLIFLPGS